jgi:hypothetical protein
MKKLGLSCTLLSMLLIAISAEANQITFTFDFGTLQGGYLHLYQGPGSWLDEHIYAGKGTATVVGNGFAPAFSAGEIFDVYCADLLHSIYSGDSPQVQLGSMQDWTQANLGGGIPGSYPWNSNPYAGEAAAFLYNTYHNDGMGQSDRQYREAGLQLAIWEVLYEGSAGSSPPTFNIAQGNIFFTGFNAGDTYYASEYLSSLPIYESLAGNNALWLQTTDLGNDLGSRYQDFIGPKAPNAVPEAATLLLVGSGMILVICNVLRKQKKSR